MNVGRQLALLTVSAALVVSGGVVAVAATRGSQPPPATKAWSAAPVDTSTEAKYTAITPCRIIDTRVAGGPLTPGAPRGFVVAGSLSAQGGNAAGCGIPDAAVAIQANVVTVGAKGSGYLKVYPAGVTAPLASFMNFRDGQALANGGAIPVDTSQPTHVVIATTRATNVVVDVSGYFIKPMWALVNVTGNLVRGARVVGAALPGAADYTVTFDRDVSQCSYDATTQDAGIVVAARALAGTPAAVEVLTRDRSDGSKANADFYLTVTC